jgi:hypothetical protein
VPAEDSLDRDVEDSGDVASPEEAVGHARTP